jgi:hypothetical protein
MDLATFTGPKSVTMSGDFAKCGMNSYEEKGGATAVANLSKNHAATDAWYFKGEPYYDYTTG